MLADETRKKSLKNELKKLNKYFGPQFKNSILK